jgi:hypothetical protein
MTELEKLNNKLNKQRGKYDSAVACVIMEVERLVKSYNLVGADLPGDGLGIGIQEDPLLTHAPIETLIDILNDKGSLTIDDIINNKSI